MGRIIGYQYDDNVQDGDAWIGSEDGGGRTKQYTAEAVANYLNIQGKISIVGQMTYEYGVTPLSGPGTFAVFGGGTDPVAFSAITKLTLSNTDVSKQRVVEFLNLLVGSDILISKQGAISTFGYYRIDNYAVNATDPAYYDLGVTFKSGNGSMEAEQIYETQNFTLAAEENISTLQTTIDAGNTYASGSSLWQWDPDQIIQVDPGEGWGLVLSPEEGVIFTDGVGSSVGRSHLQATSLSIGNLTYTGSVLATNLTANRDFQLPNNSGTLALTTDITASPWDTVTGGINYANGNVGIGTTTPSAKLDVNGDALINGLTVGQGAGTSIYGNTVFGKTALDSITTGLRNVAIGNEALLDNTVGNYNIALGYRSLENNSANNNVAIGVEALQRVETAGNNTAVGRYTLALTSGAGNTAIGYAAGYLRVGGTNGNSIDSVFIGSLTKSNGLNSENEIVIGTGAESAGSNTVVLGNDDIVSTRLKGDVIVANGNVGIGTTSPQAKLHIDQTSTTLGGAYVYSNAIHTGTSTNSLVSIRQDNVFSTGTVLDIRGDGTGDKLIVWDTTDVSLMVKDGGNVGIGTAAPGAKLQISTGEAYEVGSLSGSVMIEPSSVAFNGYGSGIVLGAGRGGLPNGGAAIASVLDSASDPDRSGLSFFYHNSSFSGPRTEGMRLNADGNVGIGTSTPDRKLEVDFTGSVYGAKFTRSDATGSSFVEFANSAGVKSIIGYDAGVDGYKIGTASATNLVVKQNGNVGIGTTSPNVAFKLDVIGNISTSGNLYIGNAEDLVTPTTILALNSGRVRGVTLANLINASGGPYLPLSAGSGFPLTGDLYVSDDVLPVTNIASNLGSSTNSFLYTHTYVVQSAGVLQLNTGGSERMRIDTSGNVGIGTTSPGEKLEVNGRIKLQTSAGSLTFKELGAGSATIAGSATVGIEAAGNFRVKTNVTNEAFTVLSTGNVGIGETSPSSKLEVRSETATHKLVSLNRAASTTAAMYLGNDSSNNAIISSNYSDLIFGRDQSSTLSEWMRIKRDGNVGIGTTAPAYKLTSYSNTDFPIVAGRASNVGDFTGIGLSGYIATNAAVKAGLVFEREASWGIGKMHFLNNDTIGDSDATLSDSKMTITSSGNVGIGTTNPGYKLEVSGTARITSSLTFGGNVNNIIAGTGSSLDFKSNGEYFFRKGANTQLTILSNGNVGIGTTSPSQKLHVNGASDGNSIYTAMLQNTGTAAGTASKLLFVQGGSTVRGAVVGGLQEATAGSPTSMVFETSAAYANPSERMRITSGGNVGIGTTSPGAKLDVYEATGNGVQIKAGDAITDKALSVGSAGTPDKFVVQAGGNVGIGTTSPIAKLTINSTSGDNAGGLSLYDGSGTAFYMYQVADNKFVLEAGNGLKNLVLDNAGNVGIGTASPSRLLDVDGIQGWSEGSNVEKAYLNPTSTGTDFNLLGNNGNIRFDSRAGSNSYINTGNVGIGTTSPGEKLHVVGNELIYGNLYLESTSNGFRQIAMNTSDGADNQSLYLCGGGTASAVRGAQVVVKGNEASSEGGSAIIQAGRVSTGDIIFKTGVTVGERMRIDSSGNVGIGTTSPTSKLDVAGGDIELDDVAAGIIMRSPDGTKYRITVANGGTLTVTAV